VKGEEEKLFPIREIMKKLRNLIKVMKKGAGFWGLGMK